MSTETALELELDHERGAHIAGTQICPSCQAMDLQAKARAQRRELATKLEERAKRTDSYAKSILLELAKELREES